MFEDETMDMPEGAPEEAPSDADLDEELSLDAAELEDDMPDMDGNGEDFE